MEVGNYIEAVSNQGPSAYQPTALPLGEEREIIYLSLHCHYQHSSGAV